MTASSDQRDHWSELAVSRYCHYLHLRFKAYNNGTYPTLSYLPINEGVRGKSFPPMGPGAKPQQGSGQSPDNGVRGGTPHKENALNPFVVLTAPSARHPLGWVDREGWRTGKDRGVNLHGP